jgi:hypothetical protein
MWMTTEGVRTLCGAEATLLRHALAFAADIVEQKADSVAAHWYFDVPPFDELEWRQQLVLLSDVGAALLDDDDPPPTRSAVVEATAAVLYRAILQAIEIEIDSEMLFAAEEGFPDDLPSWRELVLDACREAEVEDLPPADSTDLGEWELLVEILSTDVLWDEDWQAAELFLDVDPQRGNMVKDMMGIEADYFVAIPPDPDARSLSVARARLRGLLTKSPAE